MFLPNIAANIQYLPMILTNSSKVDSILRLLKLNPNAFSKANNFVKSESEVIYFPANL